MLLLVYLATPLQGIFLIITSITYIYIFKKLRKNRLALRKIIKQLDKNSMRELQAKKTQTNAKLFVPSLIILTFILFNIFPNFMYFGYSNGSPWVRAFFQWIPVLFFVGWCVDPIIYIFSNRSVQRGYSDALHLQNKEFTGSSHRRYSLVNTCASVSFVIKLVFNFIEKETLTQVFPVNFAKSLRIAFYRTGPSDFF